MSIACPHTLRTYTHAPGQVLESGSLNVQHPRRQDMRSSRTGHKGQAKASPHLLALAKNLHLHMHNPYKHVHTAVGTEHVQNILQAA
jgi:hypothetical protein